MTFKEKQLKIKEIEVLLKEIQNPELVNKRKRKYSSDLSPKYKSYLQRANKKRLEFSLSSQQFDSLCSLPCIYCGCTANGIDRLKSKEGYTIENSQPCCAKCNMMKFTSLHEDFLKQVKKIYTHCFKMGKADL